MGKPKTCRHTRFNRACPACRALRRKWYRRLELEGFADIEYGRENPRFVSQSGKTIPGISPETTDFYDRVWEIYHVWSEEGRRARDCRVAELFAAQEGDTGTIRGIARVLRAENLPPWSDKKVQETLRELRKAVKAGIARMDDNPIISIGSIRRYYKAA